MTCQPTQIREARSDDHPYQGIAKRLVHHTSSRSANRLQNLENIRLREFLIICELIDEERLKPLSKKEHKMIQYGKLYDSRG